MLRFDIFCRVIDHFGDAGVCWRLAKELSGAPFYAEVRLWIDDLSTLQKITPPKNQQGPVRRSSNKAAQNQRLSIHLWPEQDTALTPNDWPEPHPIVIEAFAGGLPPAMRAQLTANHLWIVLDHLSAEKWVEEFHGLPGHADGLHTQKYYFYPGFTENTGGLLRQPDLLSQIRHWQSQPRLMQWQKLAAPLGLSSTDVRQLASSRVFFIFQYPHAPVTALLQSLYQQEPTPPTTLLFAADQGYHYQSAQQFLQAKMSLCVKEDSVDSPAIRLLQLPFIKQQYFDQLLWSTDLNFVRGEDSWMQALWAQLPFIWQPYPQTERTHLIKLRAWLQRLGLPHAVQKLIGQWNQANPDNPSTPGNQYLDDTGDLDITALEPILLQRWQQNIRHEVHKLSMEDSLSARLIQFCKQKLNSR